MILRILFILTFSYFLCSCSHERAVVAIFYQLSKFEGEAKRQITELGSGNEGSCKQVENSVSSTRICFQDEAIYIISLYIKRENLTKATDYLERKNILESEHILLDEQLRISILVESILEKENLDNKKEVIFLPFEKLNQLIRD